MSLMNNVTLLVLFALTVISFFWGIYKTTKTQKKIYLYYTVPFIGVVTWMFFI
ncbi:MAG: hypothetical protein U9O64_05995 [Campylobacterota bacterium]|nr:hypothetical protein [Campylobacterota bacterium]